TARSDAYVRRMVEGRPGMSYLAVVVRIAGIGRLVTVAQSQLLPSALGELEHHLRIAVDQVNIVVGSNKDDIGVLEQFFIPVVHEGARPIENHVGMLRSGEHMDPVLGVDPYGPYLAPVPSGGKLAPTLDQLVLAVTRVEFHFPASTLLAPILHATMDPWNRE